MASSIQLETKNVELIRPELMLGISSYNPVIEKDAELSLIELASGKNATCDVCGVAINKDIRHSLYHKKMWFNSCSMCYYSENLDQIPHFLKGDIIYFPMMSQARLNAFMRALWSIKYMSNLDSENDDLNEMQHSFSELEGIMLGQREITESYFRSSKPDVFSSMLNLLTPEEYKQRYKLLKSFRWMPSKKTFQDEMSFWTQESYNALHPEKISGNITKFVSKYIPSYKICE
jgi:hypothetical protein